jgi:hypothetical protein
LYPCERDLAVQRPDRLPVRHQVLADEVPLKLLL